MTKKLFQGLRADLVLTDIGSNICADCGTTLSAEELDEGCCGHVPARRYFTEFEPGPECVGPDTD